jgi:hypothetical protein
VNGSGAGLAAGPAPPYVRAMAVFPPMHGPRTALRDLASFLRQRSREQVIGAALAILSTIIVLILFFVDSKINTAPGPQLTYVESWPANRTDAEIVAEQKKDAEEKAALQAERQRQFKKLQDELGIE